MSKGRIVGCLVTDRVYKSSTFPLLASDLKTRNKDDIYAKLEVRSKESCFPKISTLIDEDSDLIMGVRLIWVAINARRARVASMLVDAARRNFRITSAVEVEEIAFSQPSENGLAFAFRYSNLEKILVY